MRKKNNGKISVVNLSNYNSPNIEEKKNLVKEILDIK